MRSLRIVCLLLAMLPFAVCQGRTEQSLAAARICPDPEVNGSIGLSASYEIHGDTTTVLIEWQGCREDGMVVASLDSKLARGRRSYPLLSETEMLSGIVFVRSAGDNGFATFSYSQNRVVECVKDTAQVLSVYLTTRIQKVRLVGALPEEGTTDVTGSTKLTSTDCMDRFQILSSDCGFGMTNSLFPNMKVLPGAGTQDGGYIPTMFYGDIGGFVRLEIKHHI